MKKIYLLLFTILISAFSFGQVITMDDFTYPDGSLAGNGSWTGHSGTAGDFLTSSGQAVVTHGAPSEDVNVPFTAVTGDIYFGIDFSLDDLGAPYSGADNEYFAHFMVGTGNFTARLDVIAPTAAGDFSVGIATLSGSADATWATDLTYGTTYRAIVKYDQVANQAQLWIDASAEGDTSILGVDESDPGNSISAFGLRQSDSSENETVRVDNLVIGQSFADVTLSVNDFNQTKFSIYPNPVASGHVNIRSNFNEAMSIQVFNVLGKRVLSQSIINERLDVSSLKTGVYIMNISQGSNTATKKLIIK